MAATLFLMAASWSRTYACRSGHQAEEERRHRCDQPNPEPHDIL
jgi:hypothetical protein